MPKQVRHDIRAGKPGRCGLAIEARSGGARKTRPFGGSAGSPTFGAGPGLEPGGFFPLNIHERIKTARPID